jgi:formylglycine-generating enzyme required for sulfatase activity
LLPADFQLNNVTAVIMLRRDGTNWKMVGPTALSPINSKRFCYLAYVDASTIQVGAGEVVLSGLVLQRSTAFNITFANIDTGAEAAGTNYYVYAIPGATAGQFDAVISASASAPTGYTNYRLIGWFHNNPASAILLYSVASARADADVDYPEKGPKPGMVQYPGASWMIDIYIASDSGGTGKAIHAGNAAASAYDVHPWVNTTYFAQYKACMNAGKRLCSNEEWSMAAFGSPPGADNNNYCWTKATNTEIRHTGIPGSVGPCVSTLGCYDMTGNVWERVATWLHYTTGGNWTTEAGTWTGEAEGGEAYTPYGATVGPDGHQGPRALLRGSLWNNSVKAGGWAVLSSFSPRGVYTDIGFRCCS